MKLKNNTCNTVYNQELNLNIKKNSINYTNNLHNKQTKNSKSQKDLYMVKSSNINLDSNNENDEFKNVNDLTIKSSRINKSTINPIYNIFNNNQHDQILETLNHSDISEIYDPADISLEIKTNNISNYKNIQIEDNTKITENNKGVRFLIVKEKETTQILDPAKLSKNKDSISLNENNTQADLDHFAKNKNSKQSVLSSNRSRVKDNLNTANKTKAFLKNINDYNSNDALKLESNSDNGYGNGEAKLYDITDKIICKEEENINNNSNIVLPSLYAKQNSEADTNANFCNENTKQNSTKEKNLVIICCPNGGPFEYSISVILYIILQKFILFY